MEDKISTEGIQITWGTIFTFLLKEWRTVGLLVVLLGHAGWTHMGQRKQDTHIQALEAANIELRKAVARCIADEKKEVVK